MKMKSFALGILAVGVVLAGAKSARAACSSGLACEVCDVTNYAPTQLAAPLGPMTGDCTDADIAAFDAACLASTATQTTCGNWQSSANPACLGCLVTQQTAAQWGFLVCTSTGCQYNAAGCVDVATSAVTQEKQAGGAGSCGDALNASYGCQDYACGTCATSDFATCAQSAITNECSTYSSAVESTTGPCAALNADAGNAGVCFPQDDNGAIAMATYICGGAIAPPPDAGTTTDDGGTTTNPDAGTKLDAGSKSDAGKTSDAGSDAGTNFGGKGGCHCDAAGGGGDSLALVGVSAALAAALARRKRRA